MLSLKGIRLASGLTQEAFARIIGVSRSLLSLAEIGKRGLPELSWKRVYEIEAGLDKQQVIETEHLAVIRKKSHKKLEDELTVKLNNMALRLYDLEVMLDRMLRKRRTTGNALSLLGDEMDVFANVPSYTKDLERHYNKQAKFYCASNEDREIIIQNEIESLRNEIYFLSKKLDDLRAAE